ncbi:MAG: PKD domain-containing protein [Microscillaceae bacterium]|nr:PKD domain-containing protein [Microscillaceae bacterium]
MQVAPDGKIYVAKNNRNFLGVIPNPNAEVSGNPDDPFFAFYRDNSFGLGNKTSQQGLPNFVKARPLDFKTSDVCLFTESFFTFEDSLAVDSVRWNFDDVGSGALNTDRGFRVSHFFSQAGQYCVSAQVFKCGVSTFIFKCVNVARCTLTELVYSANCQDLSVQFDLISTEPIKTQTWDFGDPASGGANTSTLRNPIHTFSRAGSFRVRVDIEYTNGFKETLETEIYLYPPLQVELGEDIYFCNQIFNSFTLNAFQENATYRWQDGSINPSFTVTQPGKYWVEVRRDSCVVSDTIVIEEFQFELEDDKLLCLGETYLIDASKAQAEKYLWSDGSANP